MADQQLPPSFWPQMIQHSSLSLYEVSKDQQMESKRFQNYDFVFEFSGAIIYLLVSDVLKLEQRQKVDATLIRKWRNELVNQMIKRHAQLYHAGEESLVQTKDASSGKDIYFVGLTALWIKYLDEGLDARSHTVEYEYGSQFFAEDCVLDLDNEPSILQVFSYQSFMKLLKMSQTPSDLATFLQFHRHNLAELQPFIDESTLFEQFLQAPDIHYKAIEVQEQLVAAKIMDKVEPRLLKAVAAQQAEFAKVLVAETYQYNEIWGKLIDSLMKRHHDNFSPLPTAEIKIINDESMYTYRRLVEEILDYENANEAERWNGYITHQHSYHRFGRHYMLVFYAEDESSALSVYNIRNTHQDLLADLNSQFQNPVMEDFFLIGVSFRPYTDGENTEVGIDIYHSSGLYIDENTQRLNAQLAKLKAKPELTLNFDDEAMFF